MKSDSLRVGRSGDRMPVGERCFRTRSDRPWDLPSLLYIGCRVFPGGKAAGAWRWPPTTFSADVKERVELYLYSPSGLLWSVLGWTLTLPLPEGSQTSPSSPSHTSSVELKVNTEHRCNYTDRGKQKYSHYNLPELLCPPQISEWLRLCRFRSSMVKGRRLAAWAMAWSTL